MSSTKDNYLKELFIDEAKAALNSRQADYDAAYEAGKKAECDAFWDAFLENGTRTNFINGLSGTGWTDTTFKPNHDIVPYEAYMMFARSKITDLVSLLENCGVKLDFSQCINLQYAFWNTSITHIGIVDASKYDNSMCYYIFTGSSGLEKVDKFIVKEGFIRYVSVFDGCISLREIMIEGTIAGNEFNVQWSPLNHESLISILNSLYDYSTDTSGTVWLITLGEKNLAKLTDEEKQIAYDKGWNLG